MNPNRVLPEDQLLERDLSYRIVNAFFEVYNWHGFGFVESIYAKALEIALRQRGLAVDREVPIQVFFHEHLLGSHRLDMLVEKRVVIEIKSSETLSKLALRQTRNYLAAANLELGQVLHFGKSAASYRVLAPRRPRGQSRDWANSPNPDG